ARGSGFFISEDGYIITNAHVVNQAVAVWAQIPSLGKKSLRIKIVGVCPDKDIALLQLIPEDLAYVKNILGTVNYLPLGDSDQVFRADEVMAVGYPMGQESLKSTNGIISGRESHLIQMSAPINPGNSGGPVLNMEGEVIGISVSIIANAQNIGYIIPSNVLQFMLPDLYKIPLLRKPHLGILSHKVTETLTEYFGNPQPGGCYVVEVVKDSPLDKVGVQAGDMIYEINNNKLDIYGEMNVDWSEDKISFVNYIDRLAIDQEIYLVIYRNGKRIEKTVTFELDEQRAIKKLYPWHEKVDYEVFAGMVVMPLTINHLELFKDKVAGLKSYEGINKQEPVLFISHVFPNSELARSRAIEAGFTLNEINEVPVHTLDDFRNAIQKSIETGYVVIKATDQISLASENMTAVLPMEKVLEEVFTLAKMYHYPISTTVESLLENYDNFGH
ncbi:MAG: trypsin-like peptidase domain-containing protein, partial [Candidatus Babeliales bacterium]